MMKGLIKSLFIVLLMLCFGSGCALIAHYGEYYGRVVDGETKEPLEGAAVLAVYKTQKPSPGGPVSFYLDAQETVTDKNGEFKIPSLTVTTFRMLHRFDAHPQFTIFKPEYGWYPWHKDVKPMFVPNGSLPAKTYVTIELPKLKTKEESIRNTDHHPLGVPDGKMRKLIELNNIERTSLGFDPSHIQEKKK